MTDVTFPELRVWLIAKGWREIERAEFVFPRVESHHYRQVFVRDTDPKIFMCLRQNDIVVWRKKPMRRVEKWMIVRPGAVQIRDGALVGFGFQP